MKNRVLLLILMIAFQFLEVTSFAQIINWKPADVKIFVNEYQKVADYYNRTNKISMQMTYTSFQTHTVTDVADKSVGFYKKDGLYYHTYIMGNRTIQNSKYKFTVNEESKTILVSDVDDKVNTIMNFDEKKLDSTLIVSLKMAQLNNGTRFRIDYKKGSEIEAIEYSVSKLGFVNELDFFYCHINVNEEGNNEVVYPHLNISFTDVNAKYVALTNEFDEKKYFFEKDEKLQLSSLYKSYKLRDYRKIK